MLDGKNVLKHYSDTLHLQMQVTGIAFRLRLYYDYEIRGELVSQLLALGANTETKSNVCLSFLIFDPNHVVGLFRLRLNKVFLLVFSSGMMLLALLPSSNEFCQWQHYTLHRNHCATPHPSTSPAGKVITRWSPSS